MQVKKFEAQTLQEALDAVKLELGPEAIILQTKRNRKRFGLLSKPSIEVTAAVSERSIVKKKAVENRLQDEGKENLKKLTAEKQATVYNKFFDKYLDKIAGKTQDRVEIQSSKNNSVPKAITKTRYIDIQDDTQPAIQSATPSPVPVSVQNPYVPPVAVKEESMTGAQALLPKSSLFTAALQDAFEQLVVNGMDKRLALDLLRRAGFELGAEKSDDTDRVLDEVAGEIIKGTEVLSLFGGLSPGERAQKGMGPFVVALLGVTGVGKTTTIAKLTAEAMGKRQLKVGLINFDVQKPTAFDQLATYAKILNVPFRSITSIEDLKSALSEFQNMDLVLVDTAGTSQRDFNSLKELEETMRQVPGIETALVLSATTRDAELYEIANRFSIFRPRGLILSKLDEAMIYGVIYNICRKTKLPLLYFTLGQRVPEDLEEATQERVAALIMEL